MGDWSLRCAACGWEEPEESYIVDCPACGGFIEVAFPRVPARLVDDAQPSIFRFHPVMPYDPVRDDIAHLEDLAPTPMVFAERLSADLDVELWFKDETMMPSGTWKDREGFV